MSRKEVSPVKELWGDDEHRDAYPPEANFLRAEVQGGCRTLGTVDVRNTRAHPGEDDDYLFNGFLQTWSRIVISIAVSVTIYCEPMASNPGIASSYLYSVPRPNPPSPANASHY